MESQERIQEKKYQSYADVNKEIQALISSKENTPIREIEKQTQSEDIITLLETLNKTYSEINAALQTENSQALKDVILKSDIKMSMVCETLLETLRKTTEEKNRLIKDNQNLEKEKRDLESINFNNKINIERIRNELEFKKTNVDELNRIIADQKNRMTEFKQETNKAVSEVNFFKAKISEIENLRERSNKRMEIYEKELEALNVVIKDKEERIEMLEKQKREEEDKNSGVKTRLVELESIVDALNKKLQVKDKNMELCNSELSKILCENKKIKIEHEKYKEGSKYYEGLYNSLNSQNGYLNAQLNKLLKMNEYNKDIEGAILKFKKKLKKKNKKIKKLENENKELKIKEESVVDETSENLIKKIEGLNEKYKKKINELEDEKKSLENKMRDVRIDQKVISTDQNLIRNEENFLKKDEESLKKKISEFKTIESKEPFLSFKNYNKETEIKNNKPFTNYYNKKALDLANNNNLYSNNRALDLGNDNNSLYNNNLYNNLSNNRPYLTWDYKKTDPVNLYNNFDNVYAHKNDYANNNINFYDEHKNEDKKDDSYLKLYNLENNYDKTDFVGGFVNESSILKPENKESVQMNNFDKLLDDLESVESVKTYHTSSTLKEMLKKTDNLQKKFEDLENKLAQINEGETMDKLTDKIKTCNSYYSDWNAESDDYI